MNLPRKRILKKTCFLLHQQGCNNHIIMKANVSKSTFYTLYKLKDDLCIEYLHKGSYYWVLELENFTKAPSQ